MTDNPASIIAPLSDTQAGLDLLAARRFTRPFGPGWHSVRQVSVSTAGYTHMWLTRRLAQIAEEISEAYAALPGYSRALAVRSSATTEDLAGASFAGQPFSPLNICGREAVLEAVQTCEEMPVDTLRSVAYQTRPGNSLGMGRRWQSWFSSWSPLMQPVYSSPPTLLQAIPTRL